MLTFFANPPLLTEEAAPRLVYPSPTATPGDVCFVLHFFTTPGF